MTTLIINNAFMKLFLLIPLTNLIAIHRISTRYILTPVSYTTCVACGNTDVYKAVITTVYSGVLRRL